MSDDVEAMWSCAERTPADPATFRRVLGNFATGVCVVTATEASGEPVGLTVNSFTSASLAPPLVAFFAKQNSRTRLAIATSGRFCVNVLAVDQAELGRRFATAASAKYDGVSYSLSGFGVPVLHGALARIECSLQSSFETGDHEIILGCVHELAAAASLKPLIAFRGALTDAHMQI